MAEYRGRSTWSLEGSEMYVRLAIVFGLWLLVWWLAFRWIHFHRRRHGSNRIASVLETGASPPLFRMALRQTAIISVAAILSVIAGIAVLYVVGLLFGPFRPIHEWIQ
jgi:hypothetical protein